MFLGLFIYNPKSTKGGSMFNSPRTLKGVIEKKKKTLIEYYGINTNAIPEKYFARCQTIVDVEKLANKLIYDNL